MASVFKPKNASRYVILYYDERGRRRKKAGTTDKTVTMRLARELENRIALRKDGVIDPKVEATLLHESRRVSEHLREWHEDLIAKGRTVKHSYQYRDRAGRLIALAKGVPVQDLEQGRRQENVGKSEARLARTLEQTRLSDLDPTLIQKALDSLRDFGKSHQTANHYRAALRAFSRWLIDNGRLRDNPMRGVKGYNVEEDLRHKRRAISDQELARLIETAIVCPDRFGMTGALRAMAYRVAAATGFRVDELRSLTPDSFRLDGNEPSIFLRASATKSRRAADQPIPAKLARDLRSWLAHATPGRSVFPLHHETAKAIRYDLEAAGIPYETDEGVADFHSLRSYFTTSLVRSGASIKTVQTLARHAKPETTLRHYTKVSRHDLRGAVEALCLEEAVPQSVELRRTGTESSLTATDSATKAIVDGSKSVSPKAVAIGPGRFAKPLGGETCLGGSNPPLSVSASVSGRQQQSDAFILAANTASMDSYEVTELRASIASGTSTERHLNTVHLGLM